MPGTGSLRRSSAPARIKALVRKSRSLEPRLNEAQDFFSTRIADHKMLGFLEGLVFLRARQMGSAQAGSNTPTRS